MPTFRCSVCEAEYPAKVKKCETPKCKGAVKLVPDKVEKIEETISAVGGNYYKLGQVGSYIAYGRIDRTALRARKGGDKLNFAVYESAMRKGIISSRSTGKDGVKQEPYGWVIKTTISQALATGGDNTLSLIADARYDGSKLFLDFNDLTWRH